MEGESRYVEIIGEVPNLSWGSSSASHNHQGAASTDPDGNKGASLPGNRNYEYDPGMTTAQARHLAFSTL